VERHTPTLTPLRPVGASTGTRRVPIVHQPLAGAATQGPVQRRRESGELWAVPGGEAEGVACGVGVDEAVVGVRLVVVSGGAGGEDAGLGGLEIVDEELEMHLHGYVALRPLWCAEVGDLLESDTAAGPGGQRAVFAAR